MFRRSGPPRGSDFRGPQDVRQLRRERDRDRDRGGGGSGPLDRWGLRDGGMACLIYSIFICLEPSVISVSLVASFLRASVQL